MTNIYVSNLSYTMEESDLRREFERYGRVVSVRIVSDPATRRSRGFAFVTMPRLEDADEAIQRLSGRTIQGRQIRVTEAHDDRKSFRHADAEGGLRNAQAVFDRLLQGASQN